MKVNIKMLSEITGFSPATISNALNGKRGVSKETAEKIFAVAREHGYMSESKIKNIKLVIYKNSGIVVSDTPFFSALIEGIEMEGRSAGYETTVFNLHKNDPEFDTLLSQLLNDQNTAIVLLATEMTEEEILPFQHAVAPIVIVDNWFESLTLDSVLMSNTDSVCTAVEYLIEMGHKKIGYLKSSIRIKNFLYREQGYERAVKSAGLPLEPKYTFMVTPTMDGAYEDMKAHLQHVPQLPTAFFADNDIVALGAMKALKEFGYKIPRDVSIIGLDDMPFCTISSPALTTIRVRKQEMGQTAVRRLLELIKYENNAKLKIQVCNEFVVRESVRDLRA